MLDLLDSKGIYERVDALREAKGWSLYALAKQAAVPVSTIYHWKERQTLPTLELLDSVCYALGISVVDFLMDGDEPSILNDDQKELLTLWAGLSPEHKKSIINLIKSMQY